MGTDPLLPLLYFAPLAPGSRIGMVTDRPPIGPEPSGLLNLPFGYLEPGEVAPPCDVLVIDVQSDKNAASVASVAARRIGPGGCIIMCHREPGWAKSVTGGIRRWSGRRAGALCGRETAWEFLVEPDLDAPTFLVRPGYRSDIPGSSRRRWRSRIKRLGLFYLLPRHRVTIHGHSATLPPVLDVLRHPALGGPGGYSLRSIYISGTGVLIVRAQNHDQTIFCRFPLSRSGLARVRRAHELQSMVRAAGHTVAPQPIALATDGFVPYALERGARGRPWAGRDPARALQAALKALTLIQLSSPGSVVQKMDGNMFERLVETRLKVIEGLVGESQIRAVRARLQTSLLDRAMLLSICHGDFKIGNCLFDGGEVTGLVDWDLGSSHDLAILDVVNLFARMAPQKPLSEIADQPDVLGSGYREYIAATGASYVEPEDVLLLWHVDRVAKQIEYGHATSSWIHTHVGW
jgi:aminoglycoside phosphotransferase (APT) family kinase protein